MFEMCIEFFWTFWVGVVEIPTLKIPVYGIKNPAVFVLFFCIICKLWRHNNEYNVLNVSDIMLDSCGSVCAHAVCEVYVH